MYTILHISDLHRTRGSSISNNELLSSLVADFERSAREVPSVPRPDAIVVSGDLVEGLPLESDAYPEGLKAQYQEAIELLATLSDELLGGDRSRVVIIPGNHDVDWNCARMAFEIEGHESMDPRSFIRDPDSIFRWSWSNRKIFRLVNSQLYRQRFKYFNDMYKAFYKHAPLAYGLAPFFVPAGVLVSWVIEPLLWPLGQRSPGRGCPGHCGDVRRCSAGATPLFSPERPPKTRTNFR